MSVCFAEIRPSAVIRVTGEDALVFLQGQFTQELRRGSPQLCAFGLWLNQKGKVLADSFVLKETSHWWLISFSSPASTIIDRLQAYIIADDVELEDQTDRWRGRVTFGETNLNGMGRPAAEEWIQVGAAKVFRGHRGDDSSLEWILPVTEGLASLDPSAQPIGSEELERIRIEAGVPRVPVDIGPSDLPNEGGLDRNAISYSKGCYLGQEIMARLKSQGQLRRGLVRVRGEGPPPSCPSPLFVDDKKVGELRSAASAGSGFVGLALLSKLGRGSAKRVSLAPRAEARVQLLDT